MRQRSTRSLREQECERSGSPNAWSHSYSASQALSPRWRSPTSFRRLGTSAVTGGERKRAIEALVHEIRITEHGMIPVPTSPHDDGTTATTTIGTSGSRNGAVGGAEGTRTFDPHTASAVWPGRPCSAQRPRGHLNAPLSSAPLSAAVSHEAGDALSPITWDGPGSRESDRGRLSVLTGTAKC